MDPVSREEGRLLPAGVGALRRFLILAVAALALLAVAAPMRASAATVEVAAVGDMVCDPLDPSYNSGNGAGSKCKQLEVANDIVADNVDAFIPVGDIQYSCGSRTAFDTAYTPSYGQLLAKTYPIPGNHEYRTTSASNYNAAVETACTSVADADGYFSYFADNTSHLSGLTGALDKNKGYYAYNIGDWRVLAVNTNDNCAWVKCLGPNAATHNYGSTQEQWLRDELAKNANRCVMAVMHYPRYSSNLAKSYTSTPDPNDSAVSGKVKAIWQDLYAGGAEIVLSGHAHNYERFHPMDASNNRDDAHGVQQFVIGMGGNNLETNATNTKNSAARQPTPKFGYLSLTLNATDYSWVVKNIDGSTNDAGSRPCHGAPVTMSTPSNNAIAPSSTTVSARVAAVSAVSSFNVFVNGVQVSTQARIQTNCHTRVHAKRTVPIDSYYANPGTDQSAWYTQPFCTFSHNLNTSGMSGGTHTVKVVTRDPSGNETSSNTARIRVPRAGISTIRTGTLDFTVVSPGAKRDPAFSHNLKSVAYVTTAGIVVAKANGTSTRLLANTRGAHSPDWGAKDLTVVYVKGLAIFRQNLTTGKIKRLAIGRIPNLAVSPSGLQIAYQRVMPNGTSDIWVMNSKGLNKRNLTKTPGSGEIQPAWRSNLVVAFARRAGTWSVYTKPLAGGLTRRITAAALNCQQPAYSPGRTRLACVTRVNPSKNIIRVMSSGGSSVSTLAIPNALPSSPAWASNLVVGYGAK